MKIRHRRGKRVQDILGRHRDAVVFACTAGRGEKPSRSTRCSARDASCLRVSFSPSGHAVEDDPRAGGTAAGDRCATTVAKTNDDLIRRFGALVAALGEKQRRDAAATIDNAIPGRLLRLDL